MRDDSSNDMAPGLGPQFPVYPEVAQIVRTTSPTPGPGNIYPAFVQQLLPPLTLRDREACWVKEPNGILLRPAYYDSRLVGSYSGLPLYATTCCPGSGMSSIVPSSSSSVPSPPPCSLTRTAAGAAQALNVTSLTLPSVTVAAGEVLVIVATLSTETYFSNALTATWGNNSMQGEVSESIFLSGIPEITGTIFCFSTIGLPPGTGDVRVFVPGTTPPPGAITIQANIISGLILQSSDIRNVAKGSGSIPDIGSIQDTSYFCEAAISGFLMITPGGSSWDWGGFFSSGGQDLTQTDSTGFTLSVTDGYRLMSTIQAVSPLLSGVAPNAWAGLFVTFD